MSLSTFPQLADVIDHAADLCADEFIQAHCQDAFDRMAPTQREAYRAGLVTHFATDFAKQYVQSVEVACAEFPTPYDHAEQAELDEKAERLEAA